MFAAVTDPEVQKHFMNMGVEFFMGMSAIMSKVPMPDYVKEGLDRTQSNWRSANCRANEDCSARKGPKKVDITDDEEPRREVSADVFKVCDE